MLGRIMANTLLNFPTEYSCGTKATHSYQLRMPMLGEYAYLFNFNSHFARVEIMQI